MISRRILLVMAAVIAVVSLYWAVRSRHSLHHSPAVKEARAKLAPNSPSQTPPSSSALGALPQAPASIPPAGRSVPPVAILSPPQTPDQLAEIDLDKVRHMIGDYHTLMGENPVGTNSEIMTALMGANPRQATLGPPEGQKLNKTGELLDLWGTPYFFHQLSKDSMEVRSAGADRVMWTGDDAITH